MDTESMKKAFTLADVYGEEKLKALFKILFEKSKSDKKSLIKLAEVLEFKREQWRMINRNSERFNLYENFLKEVEEYL